MGGVVVSQNIKRESVRIDPAGNIVNPRTKQIVTPVEAEQFSPVKVETPVEIPTAEIPAVKTPSKIDEMIDRLVEKKVEEMVAKKVEEALSNL